MFLEYLSFITVCAKPAIASPFLCSVESETIEMIDLQYCFLSVSDITKIPVQYNACTQQWGWLIVNARRFSGKNLNYFITQRLDKQLKILSQWVRQSLYEASRWQNMFHRDCIVSLKTGDRFIEKEYQSGHPLRDKYLHLFFFSLKR